MHNTRTFYTILLDSRCPDNMDCTAKCPASQYLTSVLKVVYNLSNTRYEPGIAYVFEPLPKDPEKIKQIYTQLDNICKKCQQENSR